MTKWVYRSTVKDAADEKTAAYLGLSKHKYQQADH